MYRRNSLYYIYVDVILVIIVIWKFEVNLFKFIVFNLSKINSKIIKKLIYVFKL